MSLFTYAQLQRSWYMFFFLSPLAEMALPLDDYAFIDGLWGDWSPGYDGAWDVARVKESIGDPEHIVAAIGYYRAMYDPSLHVPELADEQAAALLPTPKPTLYLHGRDDGCMLLVVDRLAARLHGRGLRAGGRRRRRPLPAPGAARRREPPHRRVPDRPDARRRAASPGAASAQPEDGSGPAGPLANPSATSAAATRSARAAVLRPAAGARPARSAARRRAQRVDQPPPALAVRSGEAALRPRRGARPPRVGRRAAARAPRALAAQRAAPAVGARRRADRGPEVEHGLVELPRLAGRHEPVAQRPWPAAAPSGRPGHAAGQHPHAVGVDRGHVVPEGEGAHGARRVGPTPGSARRAASSSGHRPAVLGHDGGARPGAG